ncbi:THAP domain-containing protein 1 [Halyomorpha halys]|uniref:THAP domain-containing protein 1 n=1 Tax=Halyomorpha halys TaxID=286706 RepID=UPI0006D521EE|nr:uncharacterized protein LOC106689677 [Halyomorpha halys]XP_014290273.1 uncharacterized protein LOC106689677 [Halyomorpha halys]XP_014290274.1 uncharacterized protein LOC106689677 [Halyomorpha halys]
MVTSCSVFGCTKRSGKDKVSFHRIPLNPELRDLWIKAINRKNWTPSSNSKICSDHFLPSDFNLTYHSGIPHLREGAIPSVFPAFPKYSQKSSQEMTIPIKRSPSTELLNATEPIPTSFPNHQQETSYEINVPIKREPSIELLDGTGPISTTFPNYMPCEINIPIKRSPSSELLNSTDPLPLRVSTPSSQIPTNPAEDLTVFKRKMQYELSQKALTIFKKGKQMKSLLKNKRRLKKRLDKLKTLSREIKQKNSIINDYYIMLNNMPPLAKELCTRLGKSSKIEYTPRLRSFVSTLHFLSPKAYNYVRESFLSTLPHPRTLTKWYEAVDTSIAAEAIDDGLVVDAVDDGSAVEVVYGCTAAEVDDDSVVEGVDPSLAVEVVYGCTASEVVDAGTAAEAVGTARGN